MLLPASPSLGVALFHSLSLSPLSLPFSPSLLGVPLQSILWHVTLAKTECRSETKVTRYLLPPLRDVPGPFSHFSPRFDGLLLPSLYTTPDCSRFKRENRFPARLSKLLLLLPKFSTLGGKVYRLGDRRPREEAMSPHCASFVSSLVPRKLISRRIKSACNVEIEFPPPPPPSSLSAATWLITSMLITKTGRLLRSWTSDGRKKRRRCFFFSSVFNYRPEILYLPLRIVVGAQRLSKLTPLIGGN